MMTRFTASFFLLFLLILPARGGEDAPWTRVDALVAQSLREKGLPANPPISDEVFMKRIYLEIAGRLPSADEARQFLDSESPTKREQLIDRLLDSEDYAQNFLNYWADILRIEAKRSRGHYGEFAEFMLESLRENKPYDQWVREIVSAEGLVAENGAVDYTKRDFAMPLDNMAATVRVFLGVRLECAQCHDDPFDDWTQMDFYRMAAYSYGQKHISSREEGAIGKVRGMLKQEISDPAERRKADEVWRAMAAPWAGFAHTGIRFEGHQLELPHDYQYDDAEPESPVEPLTIFGNIPDIGERTERLDLYAKWMTSPENPMFTRVIVNRLWKRVMGVRLLGTSVMESIDDLSLDSEALHPELLDFLMRQMIDSGYDLRAFLGMLYKSEIYQRAAFTEDVPADIREYAIQGAVLKRARAEQIWDSLVYLINPNPNTGHWRTRMTSNVRRLSLNELHRALVSWEEKTFTAAVLKVREAMDEEKPRLDQRIAEIRKSRTGTAAELASKLQALKRSDEFTGQRGFIEQFVYEPAIAAAGGRKPFFVRLPSGREKLEIRDEWKTIDARPTEAFETKLKEIASNMLEKDFERFGITGSEDRREYRRYRSRASDVCRASAIDLPAPPGHFLRKFGQADRRQIESASTEASLIQPLALMNEQTIDLLRSPWSPLSLALAETESMDEKIETVYLSLLARRPSPGEWQILREEARERGEGFEQDLVAALLNTGEFLFIR